MNKICTDINQSKKLIELGIPKNTADMFYADIVINDEHKYNLHPLESYGFKTFKDTKERESAKLKFIPAWSLSALLKMFPNGVWYNNYYTVPILLPQIKNKWICRLYNPENDTDITYIKDNPFDAVFEMIVWLKENNII